MKFSKMSMSTTICILFLIWALLGAFLYLSFVNYVSSGPFSVNVFNLNTQSPYLNSLQIRLILRSNLLRVLNQITTTNEYLKSSLPSIQIHVSNEDLILLNRSVGKTSKVGWVPITLVYNGKKILGEMRYHGGLFSGWHWGQQKKSLRINLINQDSIFGFDSFSLIIPKTVVPSEPIIMDLANESGILTQKMIPVNLIINNEFYGLYYFSEAINSNFFKIRNLKPTLVLGNEPETGVSALNQPFTVFSHIAWNLIYGSDYDLAFKKFEKIIQFTQSPSHWSQFKEIAKLISIEEFLNYFAFNSALGIWHQNEYANIRYFLDLQENKFRPIAWDFFESIAYKNEHMSLDLKSILLTYPEYAELYMQKIWKYVNEDSKQIIQSKIFNSINSLSQDRISDPLREAIFIYSHLDFNHYISRPFTKHEYKVIKNNYFKVIQDRMNYLNESILYNPPDIILEKYNDEVRARIIMDGLASFDLLKITTNINQRPLRYIRDINRNGLKDSLDEIPDQYNNSETLYAPMSAFHKKSNSEYWDHRGTLKPGGIEYSFFVFISSDQILKFHLRNRITKETLIITQTVGNNSLEPEVFKPETIIYKAIHPWDMRPQYE